MLGDEGPSHLRYLREDAIRRMLDMQMATDSSVALLFLPRQPCASRVLALALAVPPNSVNECLYCVFICTAHWYQYTHVNPPHMVVVLLV